MSAHLRAQRTWRALGGCAHAPPAKWFATLDHAPPHRAIPFDTAHNLLVDRVDLVLAGYPFGKPLFIGLPGDAMRRLDLAPQPLPLASGHAGVVCGQPAPLLPRDALDLPLGACDAIPVHLAVSGSEPAMYISRSPRRQLAGISSRNTWLEPSPMRTVYS